MAKKVKFLNTKKVGSRIMPAAVDSAVASGGFLAARIAGNKITEKKPKFAKARGPMAFVLGTVISAVANEKDSMGRQLQNFGIGMAAYGGNEMADAFIPEETRTKMGLTGLGAPGDDNEKLAKELARQAAAEIDSEFGGVYDPGYLPTGDDKPLDAPETSGGYHKIMPPEPMEQVIPESVSQNAAASKIAVSKIEGVDDEDEIVEKLI